MKREILNYKRAKIISGCCPGHDEWPVETYGNRKSVKARSRDKQSEHQYVRSLRRRKMKEEFDNL